MKFVLKHHMAASMFDTTLGWVRCAHPIEIYTSITINQHKWFPRMCCNLFVNFNQAILVTALQYLQCLKSFWQYRVV